MDRLRLRNRRAGRIDARRQRLPRQHLCAIRGQIDPRRDDRRILHRGRPSEVDPRCLCRVMRHRVVLDRILNELKSRQADVVEAEVIRAADAAVRKRRHAHALEWRHPRFKDRLDLRVALHDTPRIAPVPLSTLK